MLKCIRKLNCLKTRNSVDLQSKDEIWAKATKDLEHITYKDTIPFIIPILYGKVIKVYDGDTITIAAVLPIINNNKLYRFSVRLSGIDSPEIKGHTQREKNAAIVARDALHKLIFGKVIELRNNANEKYGRLLADIYLHTADGSENLIHINKWMLDNKYAIPYNGGTKQQFININ